MDRQDRASNGLVDGTIRSTYKRRTFVEPTVKLQAVSAVLDEKRSRLEVSQAFNVPLQALGLWVNRARASRVLPVVDSSRGLVNPTFFATLRARLEERDARILLRPQFDTNIDLLGDPTPGRSALDKMQLKAQLSLPNVQEDSEPLTYRTRKGVTLARKIS